MAEAFKSFGLVPEAEIEIEDEFFLWPENVPAFNLWLAVQTQWRTDNGHRTGLDYSGIEVCIRNAGFKKKDRPWYFAAIQAMEGVALEEWSKEK